MKMSFSRLYLPILLMLSSVALFSQTGSIHGVVMSSEGIPIEYATIIINELVAGETSDRDGHFHFHDVAFGSYTITASFIGYDDQEIQIDLSNDQNTIELIFNLKEKSMIFDQVVVTGTKTFKRQTKSAVIVNVVDSKTLDNVQACNLSEGLKFQPGLRVETDCQTCNYTQLRMNGLAGGYSQILINGRPIFSPLTGLYGMEQLPVNMIDRIEVVRGGGSSLYGSSAVGGTVNVITKIPKRNDFEINSTYQNINGQTNDHMLSGNGTLVSDNENVGISFFINHRKRGLYDHNEDNFSELPELKNTSIGTNIFYLPGENQKLELSLSNLNEFRYGGEMVDKPAHLTQQSEERTHKVWMGSADYQINLNGDNTSIISYAAWQRTDRDHYTGIFPDDEDEIALHLNNAPYGTSLTTTIQGGLQLNHKINNFFNGSNVFTLGGEYVVDDTFDEISTYNYLIDQTTKDLGVFLQSDWEILPSLNLLSGARLDKHNLIDYIVLSPRASLLYKYLDNTQFRLSYGTGFRAPQAFDTDLHIAFAGGGVSRVLLSPELNPERSTSYSASINYDKPTEHYVVGFTLEGFYTKLDDAFFLNPIGEDDFGELFEKQNGQGAIVQGLTLELRANYDKKIQIESGFTIQSSAFEEDVNYFDDQPGFKEFIRTPNQYGFASITLTPNSRFNANVNYVYTGSMIVPHFAGAPNQAVDEIFISKSFSDLNFKVGYKFPMPSVGVGIEIYGGVKNVLNSYQEVFDIGKNRDSNFVYGPSLPQTIFIGAKIFMN